MVVKDVQTAKVPRWDVNVDADGDDRHLEKDKTSALTLWTDCSHQKAGDGVRGRVPLKDLNIAHRRVDCCGVEMIHHHGLLRAVRIPPTTGRETFFEAFQQGTTGKPAQIMTGHESRSSRRPKNLSVFPADQSARRGPRKTARPTACGNAAAAEPSSGPGHR